MTINKEDRGNLFEVIEKLECAYPGRKVLEVEKLEIYPGEIVVIIGNSGAGKSTLIETLGLMTNTLSAEGGNNLAKGKILFNPNPSNGNAKPVEIPGIWKQGKNGSEVTRVRRENFNFIFQENNLMHNLQNKENVVLADLIDEKLSQSDSETRTNETFKALHISSEVGNALPVKASGGERQRVAFARGIQPGFTVLFGDEPTGNLDEENANNLMRYLQKKIPKESTDKAAIIVSHNIDLSLKFADRIIVLTKDPKNEYYEVLPEFCFSRKSRESNIWEGSFPVSSVADNPTDGSQTTFSSSGHTINKKLTLKEIPKKVFSDIPTSCDCPEKSVDDDHKEIHCLKHYIRHILIKNIESADSKLPPDDGKITRIVKAMTWIGMHLMQLSRWFNANFNRGKSNDTFKVNQHFSKLLLEKECGQIAGTKSANVFFMILSIFITFMIIGLANGQLHDLRTDLLKDPFTLTLDVMHKGGKMQLKTREFLNEIRANPDTMNKYNIDEIAEFDRNFLTFYDFADTSRHQFFLGRSMRYSDPIIEKILDKSINPNRLGRGFNSANDIGLIVTIDILKELNYDLNTPVIFCRVYNKEADKYLRVALPVIARVDKLPGGTKNYFLYTPNFYDYYRDDKISFPYKIERNIKIAARIKRDRIEEMKDQIKSALDALDVNAVPNYGGYRKIEVDTNFHFREVMYEFVIFPRNNNRNLSEQAQLVDKLLTNDALRAYCHKNDLIVGQDIFQVHYFVIPEIPETETTTTTLLQDDRERGNISFLFKDPSMIKEFANMFIGRTREIDEDKHEGLQLDIGKVESMFIFSKVSALTRIILTFLIVIIIYANMQYINNLLNAHLYKIRRNIGTLMAFGINIKTIYKFLILSFILFCFGFAFALAVLAGYVFFDLFGILTFSLHKMTGSHDLIITLAAIFLMFFGAYLVYLHAETKYFSKTPSQLIYDRLNSNFWKDFFRRFFKAS
jgi:ABC-type lipoprotein export system ATPase subunit